MTLTDEDRAMFKRIADRTTATGAAPESVKAALLKDYIAELAYEAGLRAGMERAAKICEAASEKGVAYDIREAAK